MKTITQSALCAQAKNAATGKSAQAQKTLSWRVPIHKKERGP
jgi:hypothetical protein